MSSKMTRKLTVIAILIALTDAVTPVLAASNVTGASAHPHVRILPLVSPRIHPRAHVPSISHHVAKQLQNGQMQQNTAQPGGLAVSGKTDPAALLLPAVKAAREAARRSSSNAGKGKGKIKYCQYELKDLQVSSYQRSSVAPFAKARRVAISGVKQGDARCRSRWSSSFPTVSARTRRCPASGTASAGPKANSPI